MSGAKQPWFKFYPGDWLADENVMAMTLGEKGAYIELLALQWREGGIPNNPDRLAKILGVGLRYFENQLQPMVSAVFRLATDGRLVNARLAREREEADARAAAAAENGKRGGRPPKPAKHQERAKPNPSILETQTKACQRSESEIRDQNKPEEDRKNLSPPSASRVRFDFASVHASYPRKEGKAKGIARLRSQVTTPEEFEQLQHAVKHFAAKVKAEGTELRFVPHFSTWANERWRDYIDDPHITTRQNGAPKRYSNLSPPMPPQDETREEKL